MKIRIYMYLFVSFALLIAASCSENKTEPGHETPTAPKAAPESLVYPSPQELKPETFGRKEAERRQSADAMPVPAPEKTPLAAAGMIPVKPEVEAIRLYLLEHHKVIATTVKLRTVVLDFDKEDEYLARVKAKPVSGAKPVQMLVLLDKREVAGEARYVAVRAWATPGVNVRDTIAAHGRGDRAILLVERQGGGVSHAEVFQLASGGALETVARFGGEVGQSGLKEVEYSGNKGGRHTFVVAHGAVRDRYQLVARDKGFALVEVPKK